MKKYIFLLLILLIFCQATTENENKHLKGKLRGQNIGNSDQQGKANFIDKDINALLLLQQQVRQPNFHKNRHQSIKNNHNIAISQIKQIIDTNLNTNKVQDSKYHEWQSQTKQKLKYHINLLESAETEEESKDCCDLLDDLVQSLIISGNFVNQPVQQQPQPIIVIVEDTTPDKPEQDQPTTIDIDQNDEIQPLDFGPDQLGDKEPSESETKVTDSEGKSTKKWKKGTSKKYRNKKQKYRKVVGQDGEEEEEAYDYEEESEYETESQDVDGQSHSNKHQTVDQDQDEDEGGVAKTGFSGKKASDQDHETSQIHQKDVQKQQDDDSYDSSYGEDDEDDEDGEGKKKRKRRQFEESSKRRKSSQRNEYESNEGGYYYSGERREGEGDGTLENGYSQEKPVYQKILTLEEEASQEKHAASSEEEEEVEETITKVTGTDESIDENEEFDDSKVVVEKSTTSSKSKKSSKQSKEKVVKEPPSFSEYGFGFWFRFLTKYPEVLEEGAKEPLYFISKLSINQEDGGEDNKEEKLGDNALLVHLGQESYEFVSCNSEGDDKSISQNIDHSGDIEGVWSYLYYSYSLAEKQAIAFLKIGDEDFKHIQLNVVHPKSKYVSLTVGGTDNNRLPGFNGLFLRIVVTHNEGAFISTPEKMEEFFQTQGPIPKSSLQTLKSKEIQDDIVRNDPDDDVKYIKVGDKKFVSEYAISGWYRFKQPENQEEWHNGYRIDSKQQASDEVLGDRVFQYQIERDDGGKVWSTTYSYLNIKGEGKLSLPQNALHNDRHLKWHFVYQSYSRSTRKAIFHIKFSEDEEIFNWDDINHYFGQFFYIYLGKTQHQSGWSGDIAYVQFVFGPKAYIDNGDYEDSKDLFRFKLGSEKLEDEVKVEEQKDQEEETKDDEKDDNKDENGNDDDNNKEVDQDDEDKLKNKRKVKKHKHRQGNEDEDNSSSSSSESDDEGDDENEKNRKKQEKQEKKDQKQKEKENQKDKQKEKEKEQGKDLQKDRDNKRDRNEKDDDDDDKHDGHSKDSGDQDRKEQAKEKGEQKKNDQDDDDNDNNNYLSSKEKGQKDVDRDGDKKGKSDKNEFYDSDTNEKNPIFDKEKSDDKFFETYGYGFWFRFISTYPSRMISGKNAPWYFMSRLTSNNPYDNIRMNDRILAIWQGDGYYHFTTCNSNSGNVNQALNNNYPADIEGLWSYFYYSYGTNEQEAVVLIQYGQQEIQINTHPKTLHQKTKYLRFILGGNDQGRYPGFNGQFTLVYFSTHNAFKNTAAQLIQHLNKSAVPSLFSKSTLNQDIIEDAVNRKTDDPVSKFLTIGGGQNKFPSEYAFSGWFRWDKTTQHAWHNLFRVTIKNPSTDAFLGDRTLTCWLGLESGGILHFPTYTYNNMIGGGNTNLFQNIKHEDRHLDWFFIYFGYSKKLSQAYVFVKWIQSQNSLTYEKVNHYLVPEFYVHVGRDAHFPGFNGAIAHVSFHLGEGIFRKNDYEKQEKDVFQYNLGLSKLFKQNQGQEEKSDQQIESSFNQKQPSFEKVINSDAWLTEYGYGFWLRFLTAYPQRLISGKNEAWYFVSRLTSMEPYDNIRMNDRRLAIWQGAGFYHFTTCNQQTGNVNQVVNNNFPEDIEGLWTYVYYSYSEQAKKAIGLIKYGKGEFNIINHDTIHEKTKYVKFILGGNDQNRYPGFNGIFSDVRFSSKPGSFIQHPESLSKYNLLPQEDVRSLVTTVLVDDQVQRKTDDPISKQQTVGGGFNKFPSEYAFSGWFRWEKTIQHAWHNLFRVTIKNPSTDAFLGDRTLTCWLGLEQGGILHFPTYTYVNMVGGGVTNHYQNIKHEDRHLDWFFIYYGYSKKSSQAFIFVKWIESQNQLTYEKVNHYLVPEFYVYVGRDAHSPGLNGAFAYVSFNLGEGAFRKNDYDKHEKDAFLFKLGLSKLFKENLGSEEKSNQLLENSFNQKQPTFEKVISSDGWITEYGYGFWLRFLTTYPQRLLVGKNEAWYFVSRLTSMEPYDNIRMNDRRLAIWQGAGYYHFTTCNQQTGNVNQVINNNFPEDIEGLWTYVYYSYSEKVKKAIGLIKYGKGEFNIINHDTIHEKTKYLKFILGGNDNNRYPGFNGIFKSVTFSSKVGSFIGSPDQIPSDVQLPVSEVSELFTTKLIENQLSRSTEDQPFYQAVGNVEAKFPHEYAISGWYRWQPTAQSPWHNFFRVSIKQQSTDVYLGDRTLCMWLGLGFLHFPTYTYVNMVGAGNTNLHQNINHKDRHLQWFYVYYGYSKKAKQCYIHVKWTDSEDSLNYENVNHYFVDEFYIFVGRDKFSPGLNGKLAYVNFNFGQGSYTKDFNNKDDAFAYQIGLQNLFGKRSDFNPNIVASQILKNAYNQEAPILDNEQKAETEFEEYGYGFWMRFLTVYPVRLLAGKNEAWYFVARLTLNNPYDNIRVGDRLLAIWQGQGYYHFTTCNRVDNNPNYVQNINYPQDIEGVWTYIYYSYSADQNKAIAFIKYGDGELQSITHKVTHPKTKYLRLIIGGNDQKRYPGFNGQFYNIAFTFKSGGFVEQSSQLAGYLNKNKAPELTSQLQTDIIISEKQTRTFTQDFIQKTYSQPDPPQFSREYSMSGWFKWQQMPQHPWHNLFRVQIKQPATDAFLGDRTLCLWLGLGFLHLPTYTYDNMNGGGNTNWWQNIDHRERHTQWFYVYYGYSKIKEKAYVYVKWTNDDSSLSYERARHYYSHQYFIYVGKDPFYPGLNGQISQVRWNQGEGAYRETKDFTHENDIFGFASLKVQGVGKFDINDIQRDFIPSFQENKKGAFLKTWEDLNGVKEYGYGFWLRFLTRYPNPLNRGLQHPWSIVARLSKNNDYQDIRVGDRTLSLWLGQGFYHFTTYDGGNPNANQNVNHPADIEGLWTFIHYSHSLEKKKSIAFIKFGNEQFQKRDIPATHTSPSILKFYLGMNDNVYVAFNGQFSNVYVSVGEGVYQETEEALINNIFKQLKKPDNENSELKVREIIPKTKQFTPEIQPQEEVYDDGQLAAEYSWSGWFKWNPTDQRDWHLIVRLSDLQNSENISFLGDRTLSAWVGRSGGGIIHLSTYTYHDLRGNGNPDLWKQIQYQQDLTKWHFIYFGYSRLQRQAYAAVQFLNRAPNHEWKDVNHYLPGKLSLYVAKDKWHSTYSGNIGYLRLNTGPESFTREYQKQSQDIFGYSIGKQELNVGSFIQMEQPVFNQYQDSNEQPEETVNKSFLSYNKMLSE